MDDGSEHSYTNWDQGYPPDPNGGTGENCMMIGGTWADWDCNEENYSVCSKPMA